MTLEEVKAAAKTANVIPLYASILADTETPVSVWLKLFKQDKYSFCLESVSGGDTVARYSFIGGNPFCLFRANNASWKITGGIGKESCGESQPLNALRSLMQRFTPFAVEGLPRFCGGAVGYTSYDSIRLWEKIPDKNPKELPVDDIFFGIYKNIIAFDNREHRLLLISNIVTNEKSDIGVLYQNAIEAIEDMKQRLNVPLPVSPVTLKTTSMLSSNFEQPEFENIVEKSKEYIKAGDIFQIVLSQRFSIGVEADPFDLYRLLRTVNPSPYMYYMSIDNASVIGASPEMLVRLENGVVEVRPIAGTVKRGKTDEEDAALVKSLLADPKEIAEHVMLVDLGRNDIGRIAEYGTVKVEEMMHIEKYSHVMHIVSNVSGKLKKGLDFVDALFSCFPAGTLSGAPKIRAMEIIDELEPVRRGLYGGALGYIDFSGNIDTCIVIRTIFYTGGVAYIQAGAGIVADSVPSQEHQESLNKAGALFAAIKKASDITGL